jgi:hypothetical protein
MVLLGGMVMVFGVAFLLLGLVGAVVDVYARIEILMAPPTERPASNGKGAEETVDAVARLIEALTDAPQWLGLSVVGIALVWLGQRIRQGRSV